MTKPLRPLAMLVLVAFAIYGGFVWGRTLGSGTHPHYVRSLHDVTHLLASVDTTQEFDATVPPSDIFDTVLDHIQREYVEGMENSGKLSNGALSRLFASLNDVHTYYLEPSLRKAEQDALLGHYAGIGAVLVTTKTKQDDVDYNHLTVMDVLPGSPAERAGLRSGDFITELNGHWIIDYSPRVELDRLQSTNLNENELTDKFNSIQTKFKKGLTLLKALPLLVAGKDVPLTLTVVRTGQPNPFSVQLTTAQTYVESVTFRTLANSVGYLQIRHFDARTTEALLAKLQNVSSLNGLIVDLRSNPGGVHADPEVGVDGYDAALKLVGRLTHGGVVGMIEHKPGQKESIAVKPTGATLSVPLVVLVDHGTANLAELVASALRDAGHARIIGSHTFGDSTLALFSVFKNGGGVWMSNARLLTASGADIASGIQPDVVVSTSASPTDAALQSALRVLGAGA